MKWEVSGHTTAVLLGVASRICSKQHLVFLWCSHLAFSPFLLESMWCILTIILTQLQFGRNPVLSYQKSNFHIIDNLSIAVHTFAKYIIASLWVDEILPLRYVNWSSNFRGLLLEVEMTPPCLKHMNYFIWIHIEASVFCCSLYNRNSIWAGLSEKC